VVDRRKRNALLQLQALRLAQKSAAEAELLLAVEAERAAEAERDRSDAATLTAARRWEEQLVPRFDPALSRSYAVDLGICVTAGDRAAVTLEQAQVDCRVCGDTLKASDALHRQAESLATKSRRDWRRHLDERALHARADITAFKWSKR